VDYGFRLPSALDNRPHSFDEFLEHLNQAVHVSATPGPWEIERSQGWWPSRSSGPPDWWTVGGVRPVPPVYDLLAECRRSSAGRPVSGDHLTKRMAEDLTEFMQNRAERALTCTRTSRPWSGWR
jgi:excinuclease ABC subunit B